MSDVPPVNPFQTPISTGIPSKSGLGDEQTALLLRQTRPWTMTIGVLLSLGAAMAIVGGIGFTIFSMAVGFSGGPGMPSWFGLVFGPLYILFGVMYLIPAIMLFKYSSRISKFVSSPTTDGLNDAIRAQKSFWKFCGIAAIALIVLYFLLAIVFMLVGFAASTNGI